MLFLLFICFNYKVHVIVKKKKREKMFNYRLLCKIDVSFASSKRLQHNLQWSILPLLPTIDFSRADQRGRHRGPRRGWDCCRSYCGDSQRCLELILRLCVCMCAYILHLLLLYFSVFHFHVLLFREYNDKFC
jgi:hypothetical protein